MNPVIRILAAGLAAWMTLLPSVSLASQNQRLGADFSALQARRDAAIQKMRAETGADSVKLAKHDAEVERIEKVHFPARLAGLGLQEAGLRDALEKLKSSPSEADRPALVEQVRAHSAALGAAAHKVEALAKKGRVVPPEMAAKLKPGLKLAKQLGAVKGLKEAVVGQGTLSKVGDIVAKAPGHRAHLAPVPKAHRLTIVTPHVQQASRADWRRAHPLLASAANLFGIARQVQDLADDNLSAPAPQDLLATPEAPLSPQIVALAAQLQNDPRQIYLYVRNQIQSEPYFGSKKGALGTLLEGSGNDYDQASLLIALLRAAGIYSRYEVGKVQLSARQAMDFTNTDNPMVAVEVMDTIGMPAIANLGSDNSIVSVNLDQHPWVRAYVPYTNYRGTPGPGSRSIWVRLDPSIKATNRQAPQFSVGNNVAFDFTGYLKGTTPNSTIESPLQIYEGQLLSYVNANGLGCDSLDKLLPTNPIVPAAAELLPSELEVQLLASESVGDALDPYTDYSYILQLDNGGISPVQSLPATYGQPIALRYVGASNADQQAIRTAGSTMSVSPVGVTFQPELLVNNVVVWQGDTVAPGTPQVLSVTVNVPGLPQAVMTHNIGAGGIYAIGLAPGHPTDAALATAKDQIATVQAAVTAGTASADDLDEARAQALALTYLNHIDRDEKRIFGYEQNVGVKDVTEMVSGHYINAQTFFGTPVGETPGSWRVDVQREPNTPFSQVDDFTHLVALNELAGFQGSHWENRLFQEVFNSTGISSTNGCQLAVGAGGTLLTLTVPGTSSQLVGYDADSIGEIEAGLQAGASVSVPKSTFTTGRFQNVQVYVVTDLADGTALYREGSTFNGGENPGDSAQSQNGPGCPVCGGANQPTNSYVNLANGNYFFTRTDLTLPAVGIPINFTRSYDSGSGVTGVLGSNWWHSYERKLTLNGDGSADYTTAEGQLIQKLHFTKPPAGQQLFGGPAGWHLSLVNNGAGYTLTYKDGRSSSFDVNGYLLSDQDLNANKVTLQRNADHTVHTVTDSTGRVVLTFAYVGGYLSSVTDVAARVVNFGQTGTDLTSAKDVVAQTEHYSYDGTHHLAGRTDKNGNLWTIAYDAHGRWDLETDPAGSSMAAAYDNSGLTTSYTDRRGYSRVTTYNSSGNPLSVEDPSGNVRTFTWDTDSNKLSDTDERGNVTTFFYTSDGLANLTREHFPDSTQNTWAYGANSRPTSITTPSSYTTNTYDANGNLKTSTDALSNVTTYGYLATGQLQTVLAPGNTVATTFAYNADGTTKTITDPLTAVTTFGYDGAGHLTSLKDPGNHTRSMTVDNLGHVLTMTDALTNKTTFTYDNEGNRKTLKDPSNATTTFGYDALNRLTSTTDALSHISKTAYDPEGNVLSRTDANGATTGYSYDKSGRMLSTTDALGNVSSQGFCADLGGSPCQRVDPDGNVTTTQFDGLGRAISVTDGAGATTQTQYQSGLVSMVTDARGNQTNYNYNSLSTQLQSVNNPQTTTSYTYDARGNRATVVFGGTTTYTYDANNRVLTEKNPLNFTTTYTYNLDGTRHTKVDGNNHTTTYGYDANKRLTSVTFADATSYGFTYDSRGHRLTETSPSVTRTMTYDTLGRLATAQDGLTTKTITYGYDAVGNRSSITYDGLTTAYDYDADRRLIGLTDPTGEVTGIAYDPAGNRATLAQGNGVVTRYTYDQSNRVAKIASPIQSFAYTYDLVGNPYQKTFIDGTSEQYTYDTANELTGVTQRSGHTLAYSYNNGTIQQWQVNGLATETSNINTFNQITRLSGTDANTYTFDNDGNRLTQAVQLPGFPAPPLQNTTYTWNDDDRLSGVTLPSSATNTYGYDANGIRVSKRDSSGNVNYLIDPQTQSILATYDATMGTRLAVYNQNPQKIDEVLSYQAGAVKYYPHADMLGSVYAVSDVTTKAVATWTYDVYGARTQATGTLSYQFGYTGREHDPDTGLIYSRQRYDDAGVGQWLSPDRKKMINGPNLYGYVLDGPTRSRDPSGDEVLGPDGLPYIDESNSPAATYGMALVAGSSLIFAGILLDAILAAITEYALAFAGVASAGAEVIATGELVCPELNDPNKLSHIFGQGSAAGAELVNLFGSEQAAYQALWQPAQSLFGPLGNTGPFATWITINGQTYAYQCIVIDGLVRISTVYDQ